MVVNPQHYRRLTLKQTMETENLNIVDVLDHIFAEEAKSKRKRAYEKQIQMSGFPIKREPRKDCVKANKRHPFSQELGQKKQLD